MEVSYHMMAASVGSLLLVWSRIERAAREDVVRILGHVPKSAHGIAALLRTWERLVVADQAVNSLGPSLAKSLHQNLKRPLEVRNGICHGLIGISAQTLENRPALHWEINGEGYSIGFDDLQQMLGWLSKVCWAFELISQPQLNKFGSRGIDNLENRTWWVEEYGLDLTQD